MELGYAMHVRGDFRITCAHVCVYIYALGCVSGHKCIAIAESLQRADHEERQKGMCPLQEGGGGGGDEEGEG